MKTRTRALRAILCFVALAPIAVTSSEEPPPPWHQFFVSGSVKSRGGGSVENYTVVLMGKVGDSWQRLHSCSVRMAWEWGGSEDITVTSEYGRFSLSVCSCTKPDSIAPAIVLPDSIILGSRVQRQGLDYQRYDRTYEIDGSGSFCEGDDEVTVVDGYMYQYLDSLSVYVR